MKQQPNHNKLMQVTAVILLFIVLVMWSGAASGISQKSLKRTNDEGPVTVLATYLNPLEKTQDSEIRFEIKLDTHSVDLDQYKLEDLSYLSIDGGQEMKSLGLNKKGVGHHITNVLRFAGPISNDAKLLTLTIRNVGGVLERSLVWNLPVN